MVWVPLSKVVSIILKKRRNQFFKLIEYMFVSTEETISSNTAELDAQNESSTDRIHPVMAKDLVVCTQGDFFEAVRKYMQHLEAASVSPQEI